MVREATKVELYGPNNEGGIRRYAVADAISLTKGTFLSLVDPRTASTCVVASVGAAIPCAGFAAADKTASDGSTSLGVWTDGIFEVTCSGAVTLGAMLTFVVGNYVAQAHPSAAASGATVAGYALETGSDAEVINMRLRL